MVTKPTNPFSMEAALS